MSNYIKHIRESLGMSQRELAIAIGAKTQSLISNYETGFRTPKPKFAQKIIKIARSKGMDAHLEHIYKD